MSPGDTTELIKFILAQQQQPRRQQPIQGQDGQAAVASARVTFPEAQMVPADVPLPDSNNLLLNLLVGLLQNSNSSAPNAPPAHAAAKAQANYNLLQSYLQSNGLPNAQFPSTFKPNETTAVTASKEDLNGDSNHAPFSQLQAQLNQPACQQSHQELSLQAHEVLNNQSESTNVQQLEKDILLSINLLKELDPNMVSVAAMLALNIPSSGSRVDEQSNTADQLQQALLQTRQAQAQASTNQLSLAQKEQVEPLKQTQTSNSIELVTTPDEETVRRWSLGQLEKHVEQLKCASQAIPKHVSVALEITRRMEKKRKAKQMANHKWSAQTKAKEKQLFADMMKDNERLRKNIKILAHLPDLVIAIDVQGTIKFCSSQIENVLLHSTTDLLDSSIQDLVVPSSQRTMQRLIQDLVSSIESNAVGKDISDDEERTRSGTNNEDSLNGIPDDLKSFSSSGSNSYDKVREKRQRMLPVYKVRFVRADLTTVWCELTSSCSSNESSQEDELQRERATEAISKLKESQADGETNFEDDVEGGDELLILICIRPILPGDPVQEDLRFVPRVGAYIDTSSLSDEKSRSVSARYSEKSSFVVSAKDRNKLKIDEHNNVDTSLSLPSKKHTCTRQESIEAYSSPSSKKHR